MPSLSIATVLYNNTNNDVIKIINNISEVTENFDKVDLFLINNSPQNVELEKFLDSYVESKWIHVLVPLENNGFGAGNNMVLPYLISDYHLVMNPDIIISDSKELPKMVEYMEKNPMYGMLSPLIKFPNGEVQHLLKRKSSVWDMAIRFIPIPGTNKRKAWFVNLPDGYSYEHQAENVPGSFMLFRTNIFKQIHGFDENYFLYMEDCDITMKVNKISKVVFYPNATVYHEWQRENRKSIQGIGHILSSMIKYFNKWGWKLW